MSSADNPLRILFDEFKTRTNARLGSITLAVTVIGNGSFQQVDSYLTVEAGDYHMFLTLLVLHDANDESGVFVQGDSGYPEDGVNQLNDNVGTLFMRVR